MLRSHDEYQDIFVIPENTTKNACDFIIGDVHASSSTLKTVAALLTNEGDRLFVVGDLTDRGEDSVETIRFINQFNASRPVGNIYSIRGNHEDLCLKAISALERLSCIKECADNDTKLCMYLMALMAKQSKSLDVILNNNAIYYFAHDLSAKGEELFSHMQKNKITKKPSEARIINYLLKLPGLKEKYEILHSEIQSLYGDLVNHSLNGGRWLSELFVSELRKKIRVTSEGILQYADTSDVKMIKEYMSSLPYIICVSGENPFTVVHADLPISDDELTSRIKSGEGLTQVESSYATLARLGDNTVALKPLKGRYSFSIPTYVGHTVKGGVRPETNTFNLDVGTYSSNMLLVVNHTKHSCLVVNRPPDAVNNSLDEIMTSTQALLDKQGMLAKLRKKHQAAYENQSRTMKPGLYRSATGYFHHSDDRSEIIAVRKVKNKK